MSEQGPNGPLSIEQRDTGDVTVLLLTGELDAHSSRALSDRIDGLRTSGRRTIAVDLAEVGFVDSSGLRVLIRAHRDLEEGHGSFRLRGASPAFSRLAEITGLSELFVFE